MAAERPQAERRTTAVPATGEDLLVRVAGGDVDAFAVLYDRFGGQVYGHVGRFVQGSEVAAVCVEVFVEVWKTAARYEPTRGPAVTWILEVARRRAVEALVDHASTRGSLALPNGDLGRVVARRADVTGDLREALGALPEPQRHAVVLATFGGHTYREAAVLLGVPVGAVKGHLRDGLFRLRQVLEVGA